MMRRPSRLPETLDMRRIAASDFGNKIPHI